MADDLTELLEDDVLDTPMDENDNLECYEDFDPDDDAPLAAAAAAAFAAIPARPSVNARLLAFQDDYYEALRISKQGSLLESHGIESQNVESKEATRVSEDSGVSDELGEALRISKNDAARKDSGVSCDASPRASEDVEAATEEKSSEIESVAEKLSKIVLKNEVESKPSARREAASDSEDESTITSAPTVDASLTRIWDKLEIKVEQADDSQPESRSPPQQVKQYDPVHVRVREGEYSREEMMRLKEVVGASKIVPENCVYVHVEWMELLHPTRDLPRAPRQKWEKKLDKKKEAAAAQKSPDRLEWNRDSWNTFQNEHQRNQKNPPAFRDPKEAEDWRKSFRDRGQEDQMPESLKKPEWQLDEDTSDSSGSRQALNEHNISSHHSPVVDYSMTYPPGFEPPQLLAQQQGGGQSGGGAYSEEASSSRTLVANQSEVDGKREAIRRLQQIANEAVERGEPPDEYNDDHDNSAMDRRYEVEEQARNEPPGWDTSPEVLARYYGQRGQPQDEHDSGRSEAVMTSSPSSREEQKPVCRGRGATRYSHDADEDLTAYHERREPQKSRHHLYDERDAREYGRDRFDERDERGYGSHKEQRSDRLRGRVSYDEEPERRTRFDSYESDDRYDPRSSGENMNGYLSADERSFEKRTPARVDHRQAQRPSGSQYSGGRDAGLCASQLPKFSITISNSGDHRTVEERDERESHQAERDGYELCHEDLWKLQEAEEHRRLIARVRRNGEPIFPTLAEEYGTEIPEQPPLRRPSKSTTWIEGKVKGTTIKTLPHHYDPETDTARAMMPWEVRKLYRERGGVNSRTQFAMLLKDPESTRSQELLLNENSELQPFYGVLDSQRKESEFGLDTFKMEESVRAVERLIEDYLK